GCEYYRAKYLALNAPICGSNTAYFVESRFLDNRGLLIVDEAHGLPESMIEYLAISLSRRDILPWNPPDNLEFTDVFTWIRDSVGPFVREKCDALESRTLRYDEEVRQLRHFTNLRRKLERLVTDFQENREDWVVESVNKGDTIKLTPITPGRFLSNLIWKRGSKIILASGTIVPDYYLIEAGLEGSEFSEKDCVFSINSSFPPDRSPIYYIPVGKMSLTEKPTTFPKVIKEV
ncbi:MAG: hypothetical protein Q6370_005740, partial [Candidatus Sigynarchaeota archaeon]